MTDSSDSEKFISDEDVERLIGDGMPPEVARYVQITRGFSKARYNISVALFLIALVALILFFALFPILPSFQNLLRSTGYIHPDAILVNYPSVGGIFGVFLGIMIAGILFSLITMWNRNLSIQSTITQIQQSLNSVKNVAINRWMLRSIHQKIQNREGDVESYLADFPKTAFRFYLKFFIPLLVLSGLFLAFDIAALGYATEEKISFGRYFTFERHEYQWSEVESISTGCNPRGEEPSLHYHIHFENEEVQNLALYNTMRRGRKLDALSKIDEQIRKHDIPWNPAEFTGGLYKGQPLYDRDCFLKYSLMRIEPADRDKFNRVYRVMEEN